MVSRKIIFSAVAIALFISVTNGICLSDQTDPQVEQYIHHEFLYGTARIDYIEQFEGQNMVTCYYNYENPKNQFLVTSVEVYSGSKYSSPQLLRITRYIYNASNHLVQAKVEHRAG